MHIAEMHTLFRNLAQQMGMQNVRAILPEQIDMTLNTAISDKMNEIIAENFNRSNDRVITDNSRNEQVNALFNLYKVIEVPILDSIRDEKLINSKPDAPFVRGKETTNLRIWADVINLSKTTNEPIKGNFEFFYMVDLSINYVKLKTTINDNNEPEEIVTDQTDWFPIRIIADNYLADAIQDYIKAPTVRHPVATFHDGRIDIRIGKLHKTPEGTRELVNHIKPNMIRVSYIANPCKVQYSEDTLGENIDCDLSDNLHVEIVKRAVDLYRLSITGGLQAAQGQQQVAQQEATRNNARNEGYE